ncbi:MAG TPA: phosphoglycerate kinase [Brevundimonas diminuta]|nr:phosphoglycerate kinase [Brevundimonas diminuta]
MTFRTLDDVSDLSGKAALVRVDFNVPMEDGNVTDDTRLKAALPTIHRLREAGAKVVLLAHFDRPKGERVPSMSLKPVVQPLELLLHGPVRFADDCVGDEAKAAVADLDAGSVLLLENVRFHKGEEKNDPAFAQQLAELGDLYVNDAFSAAHRAHASTEGLARLLPAYAGCAMARELEALDAALGKPQKPVIGIVGGAKVSTKLDLLKNLVAKLDYLAIGGGMANTFLAARGAQVGKSLCEHDLAETAKQIMIEAATSGCAIVLPEDGVVAREFKAGAASETVDINAIPADAMVLDVGPKSVESIKAWISRAETLVWNGPLGAFEIEPFDAATVAADKHAAECTKAGKLVSVAGGGDTVAALNHAGVSEDFSYVSTAGGAFLEWMEGKELPGVAILTAAK